MNRKYLFGVLLVAAVAATGVTLALGHGGLQLPFDDRAGPPSASTSFEPAVTDFEVAGPTCVEQHRRNLAIETDVNDDNTSNTISQNVTVPNASATLAVGGLRSNGSNYTLTLVSRDADVQARDCSAQIRYTVTVLIPEGRSDAYSLVVRYDGEVLTKIEGSENGSIASADARAGSDSETTTETA